MHDNTVIQGLWVGASLSAMERLCIRSFLKHGHIFRLWTYGPVTEVPAGTEVCDANAILPASAIFRYSNGSLAGFANFFRYKLLLERGGWWVDLDTVCLKPFDFAEEFVFASHLQKDGNAIVCSGMIKAPPHSAFCDYAWRACQEKDPTRLVWGETGPLLTSEAVERFDLHRYVQGASAFCPVHGHVWESIFDPDFVHEFGSETYAVHLWNELWRREGLDKDARYASGCLYERLKSAYLDS
jgi:Alpha 1,4-glycosyltransferase conserved region/Glycosyltransferase sugar-binding region containing DXD motif